MKRSPRTSQRDVRAGGGRRIRRRQRNGVALNKSTRLWSQLVAQMARAAAWPAHGARRRRCRTRRTRRRARNAASCFTIDLRSRPETF
ncbi:hypothetical protein EVAR_10769_1 [Eumeta japonica]|uniref:Uncharacterized protein n=1 Tax=Eumeta variegata TaxID=151549 RepID=A0A4C1W6V9_EUMVA|nr:hypothetical protein EVAR_10769_1 [Eumeta japonica]